MFSLRTRALFSVAAFFGSIGLMAAVIFLPGHPDEAVVADLHRSPVAFALGWGMIGATAAIVVFVALSLAAWLARRWPARSSGDGVPQLYSPNQVFCGSFLGGPLAAVALIKANYLALQDPGAARKTVRIGWAMFLAFLAVLIALVYWGYTLKGVGTGIAAGYSAAAKSLTASLQRTKDAIARSDRETFRSNWRVVGVGLFYLAATFFILFLAFLALAASGLHLHRPA